MHIAAGGGLTRLLVVVLIAVMSRWLDMRTGWPGYVTLPGTALVGLAFLEGLVIPPGHRMGWRQWAASLLVLVVLAGFIFLYGG